MPNIVEITNPFEPFKDTRSSVAPAGITVREWLDGRFPGFVEFPRPTICILNGHGLLRKDWKTRKLEEGDVVNFVAMPAGLDPISWLWIAYAALVIAAVVIAINAKTNLPTTGQVGEPDPVYSLKGQRNQIRLGEPIEVPYGRCRMWPSYAAMPYNKYQNNEQWLYQLFCLGQGRYTIEETNIEDTPISSFTDVEVEICPPGTPVTLFPDNVVTSVEVANIELFGPNEPEGSGEYIEDSEGDTELGIDPTGHYAWSEAGPYVANPSDTETNKIELDLSFPRGLFLQNDAGQFGPLTVTALFEARKIDNTGAPLGDWFTIANFSKTLATQTPQRLTVECDVDLGRYEVRGARTSNKNTSAQAGNDLHWEAMRAFLPSTRDYGNVTMIAFKAKATNNLNDNSAQRFNVVGVRWLRSWNAALQVWNDEAPTRSLVWAFCDVFQSAYGGRLEDTFIDLDDLATRNALFTERDEFFDWVFGERLTVWDAARMAAIVGRAVPMLNGSRVTMVRDEPKTLPTTIFNQENIVKGSFKHEIKLHSIDAYDGLEVEYTDAETWKSETVPCLLPGEAGDNMEKVKLNGVTSRQHAYTWGMWRRASIRTSREQVTQRTGLEGHIPSFGDAIGVCHDVPRWGSGGFVTAIDEAGTGLTLSEPVTFGDGVHKIMLRQKNALASDPLTVTAGADAFHVVLSAPIDPEDYSFDPKTEPPLFNFGTESLFQKLCVVTNLIPAADDEVEIVAKPYRAEPHSYDEYIAPAKGDTTGSLPGRPALPSVTGLVVNRSPDLPNQVIATWIATRGALYYIVQLSYDGVAYETISDYVEGTNIRISVMPRYIYVRVCAVTTGAGPFAYWTGEAPIERTNIIIDNSLVPDGVSGVLTTGAFGMIWLNWTNSNNTPLLATHVYVASTAVQPAAPQYTVPFSESQADDSRRGFLSLGELADNETLYIWLVEESVGHRFSTAAGPYSETTVNGITLDHIIVGGMRPVEVLEPGDPIPSTGNYYGRQVLLQTNDGVGTDYKTGLGFVVNKVYRWEGTGTPASPASGKDKWTASAPAVDVTGTLTNAQIADLAAAKLTGTIVETQIANDAVTAAKIFAGSVTTAKLAAGAVTANEIAANAITAAKIGAGEVTAGKIAANAVTASEIAADAITSGKIQAGAIVAAAIGTNEIIAHTANIKDGVITNAKIGDAEISNAKIQDAAITSAKIGDAEITNAKIGDLQVTTLKIGDNAVTVPISAYVSGPVSVAPNATVDICSCNGLEVLGAEPVYMTVTFEINALDNNTHQFRFLRDGSMLENWQQKIPVIAKNIYTVTFIDYPGAGTYNYGFQVYGSNSNSTTDSYSKISMLALSTRK